MITDEQLDEWERLAGEASLGPWTYTQYSIRHPRDSVGPLPYREKDARFIAAAREGWPATIAEVRRLRKDLDITLSHLAQYMAREAVEAGT